MKALNFKPFSVDGCSAQRDTRRLILLKPEGYATAAIVLSILWSVGTPATYGNEKITCPTAISPEVASALNAIETHPDFKEAASWCDMAKKISKLDNKRIEFSTASKYGKSVVCITDDRNQPCIAEIGHAINGNNANSILQSTFEIETSFKPLGTIEETYRRLFYKPSKHARHSK